MTRKILNIHKFYSDDIYWEKVLRIASVDEKKSFKRIRTDLAIPKKHEFTEKVVDFHRRITKDERVYEDILFDLLSPVEEPFISG